MRCGMCSASMACSEQSMCFPHGFQRMIGHRCRSNRLDASLEERRHTQAPGPKPQTPNSHIRMTMLAICSGDCADPPTRFGDNPHARGTRTNTDTKAARTASDKSNQPPSPVQIAIVSCPQHLPAEPPAMSLVPPFTLETATAKVQRAQNLWNTKDPELVAPAYTEDSIWRNRDEFLQGREAIKSFLRRKWSKENGYRLRKELFCFSDNKIAVQFWYEYHDDEGQWWRAYGLEHWTFDAQGLMQERRMSGNDVKISDDERWFKTGLERGPDPAPKLL